MGIAAGGLKHKIRLQKPVTGLDEWGSTTRGWVDVVTLKANIKGESGLSAIKSAGSSGIPAAISRYSLEVRASVVDTYGVDPSFRAIYAGPHKDSGTIFSITGVSRDFNNPSHAYILAEVGGNGG